jgi:serine protease
MRKLTLLLFVAAIVASCRRDELTTTNALSGSLVYKQHLAEVPSGSLLSREEVDALILGFLRDRNDFRWEWLTAEQMCSVMQLDDQTIAVGYKPASVDNVDAIIHEVDVQSGAWKEVHDNLVALVVTTVSKNSGKAVKPEDIIVDDDTQLPVVTFRLTDREAITQLYNLVNVRYLEPLDYWPNVPEGRSTSGCSSSTQSLNLSDYTVTTPNCLVPWNFQNLNVPAAWNVATGQGITIGVIDAGISSSQALLNSGFNNGDSNVGRSITTDFTFGSSAFASCTHGTSMTGAAAGPRNNSGAAVGIAYRSNVHFIRACQDVVLDQSGERTGTRNALVRMGDRADVRIVSVSIGTPFYSSTLQDGVNYCHNKGKMIMAAAGTSFSWTSWWGVVYPAAFSNVLAITGVNESSSTCNSCHDGSAVDFTVPMERNANSNRNSLSLAASGNTPVYIGGSSVATANAAGIAALVWSVNPSLTRTQVYNCMRNTAQYYPGWSSSTGFGNLNAGAAVNMALTQ